MNHMTDLKSQGNTPQAVPPKSTLQTPVRKQQWIALLVAVATLAGIIVYNGIQMADHGSRPLPAVRPEAIAANVSVIDVETGRYRAHLSAYGNAQARYQMTLQSQVTGEVMALSPQLDSGGRIRKGDLLLRVDDSDYQAAVASARAELASAQVDLLEEQREGEQARAEWNSTGLDGTPDSELVFRQPQLEAAQAAVINARSQLHSAERDLANAEVKAPFNGLVVERLVAPGNLVQVGTELATLYSSDEVEITLELGNADWNMLPTDWDQSTPWPVQLQAVNGSGQWQGMVSRVALHLNEETRQRALVVKVNQPLEQIPTLLPGTFVEAQLNGMEQDGLWQLPPSALSQRSEVWYVAENNTLESFSAQVLFSDTDAIYVRPPAHLATTTQQVLVRPLNSYLQGMLVNPQTQKETTDE